MYKILYLISLSLGVITLLATFIGAFNSLSSIEPNTDNGGAFIAFVSMGIVILGICVTTVFGIFSGSVLYIYEDAMPRKYLYKLWWPILLSTPGILAIIFMLKSLVINAL